MPKPTGTTERAMFILQPHMPLGHSTVPTGNRLKQYGKDKPGGRGKNYFAGRTKNVPIARAGERARRWVRLSSTQMGKVKGNQGKKKSSKTLNFKPVGIKGGGGAKAP